MKAATITIAAILSLGIALPGAAFLFGSSHSRRESEWLKVASDSSLAEGGTPRLVPVRVARTDVWSKLPDEIVTHIFLRRVPETGEIVALHSRHSRFGIAVDYDEERMRFRSQCWDVEFDLNGAVIAAERTIGLTGGMRPIEVKIVAGEVFVRLGIGDGPHTN